MFVDLLTVFGVADTSGFVDAIEGLDGEFFSITLCFVSTFSTAVDVSIGVLFVDLLTVFSVADTSVFVDAIVFVFCDVFITLTLVLVLLDKYIVDKLSNFAYMSVKSGVFVYKLLSLDIKLQYWLRKL